MLKDNKKQIINIFGVYYVHHLRKTVVVKQIEAAMVKWKVFFFLVIVKMHFWIFKKSFIVDSDVLYCS